MIFENGFWIDINNNKWSGIDESEAIRNSTTLVNCYNCTNCIYCENCIGCVDCSYCYNSTNCTNCVNCCDCSCCQYCISCLGCSECTDCTSCKSCYECKHCSHCEWIMGFEKQPKKYTFQNTFTLYVLGEKHTIVAPLWRGNIEQFERYATATPITTRVTELIDAMKGVLNDQRNKRLYKIKKRISKIRKKRN